MIIERSKNEIIIRLPADINIDDLQDMTDWFQFKETNRKSKAKQADVDSLHEHKDKIKKYPAILIMNSTIDKQKQIKSTPKN